MILFNLNKCINILKYVSFQSICAFLCSFIIVLLIGNKIITSLKKLQKNGQPIREDGPESHKKNKKGIPTMGGIMVLISVLISTFLFMETNNLYVIACLIVTLSFGFIGLIDDYRKLRKNNSRGMTAKSKLLLEIVVVATIYYILSKNISTIIYFPIFKNLQIDIGPFFIIWAILVIVGSANAVNLTDGLDGLAMGPVIISSICLAIIAYLVGNIIFANYLHVEYVPGLSEICIFLSSLVGASLGFMWFNAPPAKIFMGDTGSLAIGGALGFVAVLAKQEFIFAIIGGIFVIEAISDILQVLYFKITKGKRIFLMAPIHHHYEKKGWAESTIVFRFWIISIVLGILGLAMLKVR